MGMGIPFGSARRSATKSTSSGIRIKGGGLMPGDPNPERFRIVGMVQSGNFTAADIVWPDAKNYDGRKIAAYRASRFELAAAVKLDPHFQEERGPLVPIARFEPTDEGWRDAIDYIDAKERKELL